MGFVINLVISLILGVAVMFLTGNLIFGGIVFIVLLIFMSLFGRKKQQQLTSKEEYLAKRKYFDSKKDFENEKRDLQKLINKGKISPQQAKVILANKQRAAA